VFLDGTFSHAIEHPLVLGTDAKVPSPCAPTLPEVETARRIVARITPTPLYARVDFLASGPDRWLLGELELIEPELFFRIAPDAAGRFADAIIRRLPRRSP
jgi:hypothetical protein